MYGGGQLLLNERRAMVESIFRMYTGSPNTPLKASDSTLLNCLNALGVPPQVCDAKKDYHLAPFIAAVDEFLQLVEIFSWMLRGGATQVNTNNNIGRKVSPAGRKSPQPQSPQQNIGKKLLSPPINKGKQPPQNPPPIVLNPTHNTLHSRHGVLDMTATGYISTLDAISAIRKIFRLKSQEEAKSVLYDLCGWQDSEESPQVNYVLVAQRLAEKKWLAGPPFFVSS